MSSKKRWGKKRIEGTIPPPRHDPTRWSVRRGRISRASAGRVGQNNLFKMVGEKIPFEFLKNVEKFVRTRHPDPQGVYLAHDSMGCTRYSGRGAIFWRLGKHKARFPSELAYFSFYLVKDKKHEREIETLIIRAASFLTVLNTQKVQDSINPGNVLDYEVGTEFVERQAKRGPK